MKRLLFALALIGALLTPAMASAVSANWTVQLSSPYSASANKSNSRKFNLVVSVSSVNASDVMNVKLYRSSTLLASFADTSSESGQSWSQAVTVPNDGTFTFKAVASNDNGDPDKTVTTTVKVDTTKPVVKKATPSTAKPAVAGDTTSDTASTTNQDGVVTNDQSPAATTSPTKTSGTQSKKDTASTPNNQSKSNSSASPKKKTSWATVVVTILVLGALYYAYRWFAGRVDKD